MSTFPSNFEHQLLNDLIAIQKNANSGQKKIQLFIAATILNSEF